MQKKNVVFILKNNMVNKSPLLHGQKTKTPLDLITERLFFVFPLNDKQIQFLNTIIYKDDLFWINYWSLTHTLFAMIWALIGKIIPVFNLKNYLIFHTTFELWELWAGGYLTGEHALTIQELVDGLMDTLFGIVGFYILNIII